MTARHKPLALFAMPAAVALAALALLWGTPAQARDRIVVGSHHVAAPGIGFHRHHTSHTRYGFGAPINAYTYYPRPYVYASSPFAVAPPPPPPPPWRMYRDYGPRYYDDRFYGGPPRFAPDPFRSRYYPGFGPRYYRDRPYSDRHYAPRRYYDRSTGDRYIERRIPAARRGDEYIERRIPIQRHRRR